MRINTSTPTLFALSSLLQLGSSLPFFHRRAVQVEPLVRRATYSVVPVDGGPWPTGANGSPNDTATVVETVVQTQAPATTKTIIETDNITLAPTTDYVVSTRTAMGSKTTQTIIVTLTPSASTTITTYYSVIDVNPSVITTEAPAPSATSLTSSPIPSPSESSSTPASTTTKLSSEATASSIGSSTPAISTTGTSSTSEASPTSASATSSGTTSELEAASTSYTSTAVSTGTSILSSSHTTPAPTSSKQTYNNGQWHTTYPTWSNSTRTATPVVKSPKSIPAASLPTLPASEYVRIPEDSVAGLNRRSEEHGIEKREIPASPNYSAVRRSDATSYISSRKQSSYLQHGI